MYMVNDSGLAEQAYMLKTFNLQIKDIKTCENVHKTLNYSIHSSKKQRQYESNKVDNTATKHSLSRKWSMSN